MAQEDELLPSHLEDEFTKLQREVGMTYDELAVSESPLADDYALIQTINYIWILWCDFHLYISNPFIAPITPPIVILPELNPNTKRYEFVYPILDHGYYLSTSRGADLIKGLRTMSKFYNTIEKMVKLLVERLTTNGISAEEEVQVAFQGHQLAQRKAFESILNLPENVIVTNFEPGEWGERFMGTIKRLAENGYGVPKVAPRSVI